MTSDYQLSPARVQFDFTTLDGTLVAPVHSPSWPVWLWFEKVAPEKHRFGKRKNEDPKTVRGAAWGFTYRAKPI